MIRAVGRSRISGSFARAVAALLVGVTCTAQQAAPTTSPSASGIGGIVGLGVGSSTAVLFNGKIAILDAKNTVVDAIAIRDGKGDLKWSGGRAGS